MGTSPTAKKIKTGITSDGVAISTGGEAQIRFMAKNSPVQWGRLTTTKELAACRAARAKKKGGRELQRRILEINWVVQTCWEECWGVFGVRVGFEKENTEPTHHARGELSAPKSRAKCLARAESANVRNFRGGKRNLVSASLNSGKEGEKHPSKEQNYAEGGTIRSRTEV